MGDLSAEEAKRRYQVRMGEELGTAFYTVTAEVVYLHTKWGDYVALFGAKPERIELLNRAAPAFFGRLQNTLFDDILLHIFRLTDKRKDVLSIERLVRLVADASLQSRLIPLVADLRKAVRFCHDWRNRRIAHTNRALAMGQPAVPLAAASRAATREAIGAITAILRAISDHYCDCDLGFPDRQNTSAIDLLYVLHDGLRAAEERQARIMAAIEYRPEDYATPDL